MDTKDTNSTAAAGDTAADGQKVTPLDEAREKFTRVAEEMKDRYGKVKDDVQRKAVDAERELHRGAEKVRERYGEAEDRLRQTYHEAQDRAGEWNTDFNDYVREHPGKAVLLAAGLGFFIGLVFRRGR